jgi:hypothetical protein
MSMFGYMYVPEKRGFLKAVGTVSIRHAHLDHVLRKTTKTLSGVTVGEALRATDRNGSAKLRDRIDDLARKKLGEGADLIRLQALLERARILTDHRNRLIHEICEMELDENARMRPRMRSAHGTSPLPKVTTLRQLGDDLAAVTQDLNEARLKGFLRAALSRKALA